MDRDELLKARDRQQTSFPWVDLRNQDLRSLDLRQCNLRQAKLEGADCSLANLVNACLIKVEAHQVSFEQALLNQVRGTNAILTGANFEAAILSQSDFHKANFQQARLANAQAEQVNFSQSNLKQAECQNILAMEANFQEAQLQGGIWVKARLTRANFAGADLTHCNFQGADLRSVDLREAQLDNTNFSEADLRGAKLTWATNPLHHAEFTGAIMPDGVVFDDQWQPPQIQAKPEPYLRPTPPAPQTPDHPNRFTLVNPFFEVPGAGPKELPPPPKTLGQWRRRLPWAGLVGLMCAYAGWGAILIHLQAPLTAIALLLLSSFLPAMDVATLPYIPLMGFVAVILAIPNPIFQGLILAVALVTGLSLGISGRISIGWSYWRALQAALWITEAVIAVMLLALWTLGGSSTGPFSSLPLALLSLFGAGLIVLCAPSWLMLKSEGFSMRQRSLISFSVTSLGLLLGKAFGM